MRKLLLLIFLTILSLSGLAQKKETKEKKLTYTVHLGYNLGGLAPISFPNNIRKIDSYSPAFSPSFGYEMNYKIKTKWGIGIGLRMDWKSMKVTDSVQYFHTLVSIDGSSLEGDFTGTNTTNVRNVYLSLPVQATYFSDGNWRLKLGVYFGYLVKPSFNGSVSNGYLRKGNSLGEKVIIDYATFDFAENQRKFDFGISGGAEKNIYKSLAVKADLQFGLRPVFPKSFTGISFNMYNIFATIGLAYHFE